MSNAEIRFPGDRSELPNVVVHGAIRPLYSYASTVRRSANRSRRRAIGREVAVHSKLSRAPCTRRLLFALCLAVLLHCALVSAANREKDLPLWELGLGVAPIVFSNYRGADQQSAYVLPLPYIIYRGDRLKVDRNGPRSVLFDTERLELNISFDAAVPVDSDDNDARAGMDDLDATVQIGPMLKIYLTEKDAHLPLRLNLPLRAVIATDFTHVKHVGWLLHPQLWLDVPKLYGWSTSIGVGPIFADKGYHDYYYGVSSAFATASRAAYEGNAGYSGISVLMGTKRRFDRLWVGAFLRYDNLTGAAFEDSPLFETEHAFIAGAAIAWIFWQSEEHAAAE